MGWIFLLCGGLAFAQETLPLSLKRAVEIALGPGRKSARGVG